MYIYVPVGKIQFLIWYLYSIISILGEFLPKIVKTVNLSDNYQVSKHELKLSFKPKVAANFNILPRFKLWKLVILQYLEQNGNWHIFTLYLSIELTNWTCI